MAKLPAFLTLGLGGGATSLFDNTRVAIEVDGRKHSLHRVRGEVDNHRIGLFFHAGLTVWVVKVGH